MHQVFIDDRKLILSRPGLWRDQGLLINYKLEWRRSTRGILNSFVYVLHR